MQYKITWYDCIIIITETHSFRFSTSWVDLSGLKFYYKPKLMIWPSPNSETWEVFSWEGLRERGHSRNSRVVSILLSPHLQLLRENEMESSKRRVFFGKWAEGIGNRDRRIERENKINLTRFRIETRLCVSSQTKPNLSPAPVPVSTMYYLEALPLLSSSVCLSESTRRALPLHTYQESPDGIY
jgi:hypothetical protein